MYCCLGRFDINQNYITKKHWEDCQLSAIMESISSWFLSNDSRWSSRFRGPRDIMQFFAYFWSPNCMSSLLHDQNYLAVSRTTLLPYSNLPQWILLCRKWSNFIIFNTFFVSQSCHNLHNWSLSNPEMRKSQYLGAKLTLINLLTRTKSSDPKKNDLYKFF